MKNPLDYELDDEALYAVERLASDELSESMNEIFFFGKIIDNDRGFIEEEPIDEETVYCQCPDCGKIFESEDAETGGDVQCPNCGREGVLFDFRDKSLPLESINTIKMAYFDVFEKGYCLRLFDVGLYFADREYDNYKTLSCEPYLSVLETGREYWCEGKISFYRNGSDSVFDNPVFYETETLDDGEGWIVNYDNEFDVNGSGIICDLLSEGGKTFMESATRGLSYRAFSALKKYGFDALVFGAIYVPKAFPDSAKISELLGTDYNQIKANFNVEYFDVYKLLAARKLSRLKQSVTIDNVEIAMQMDARFDATVSVGNVRKTMKYLRNQISRTKKSITARDYADYIEECRKLGYDLDRSEIRYPSDLGHAHAKTSALVKIEQSKETDQKVREVYDRFHKFCEWSDGLFTVIMPSGVEAIVNEGAEQNHCVGNYCERVAAGEDLILFVRRAENQEKAFYTLEIRPNLKTLNIVQCRGYHNEDESEEIAASVKAFLERYAQWFNHRKAESTCETIRRYFKAVKKTEDGRYVSQWDGKTEYKIGEVFTAKMCDDPDRVAARGIHLASLDFAKKYGDGWDDAAILEIEVDMHDVVIPDAKDQIRTKKGKVLREVPKEELGEWGARHAPKAKKTMAENIA